MDQTQEREAGARAAAKGRWLRLAVVSGAVLVVTLLVGTGVWLAQETPAPRVARSPAPSPAGTRLDMPTPSPSVAASPTAAATPRSARRVAPEAFGQLPLLALPGDHGFGPPVAVTYERGAELGTLPTSADVYRLTWPAASIEIVRDLSRRLGLTGTVDVLGPDAYQVVDRANGRLFVAHGRVVYSRGGQADGGAPDLTQAPQQARRWLMERDLLPDDAGPPRVSLVPETGLAAVIFTPLAPQSLITPEPSLTVTLDGSGAVREMDALWPAEREVASYPLADLDAAWAAVQRGDGFLEIEALSPLPATAGSEGQRPPGEARLTRVRLGYALAAGADASEPAYLQPVFIFSGTLQVRGQATPLVCHVYLPALRDYRWPRG